MNKTYSLFLWVAISQTLITACSSQDVPTRNKTGRASVSPSLLSTCAKCMRTTFPASTEALACQVYQGMDQAIALKARMAREELPLLLQGSPFRATSLRSDRRFTPSLPDLSWWNAESAVTFLSEQVALPDGSYLDILVDLDDPGNPVVYLFWHEV